MKDRIRILNFEKSSECSVLMNIAQALRLHNAQAVEIVCGAVVKQVNASPSYTGQDCPAMGPGCVRGKLSADEIKFIARPTSLEETPKLQSDRFIEDHRWS
ncbi:hypothetical protein [Tabrizicola sp.]|uniref:hypothetical protein n=1 Tax=Tabrizicola sp. TaxID=2005166 RepID=UPI00273715B5|nr:hypothetical protein [Tabrizicola sp.]MDP3198037.1 hypothetical protein [Tabrizicola sp.]